MSGLFECAVSNTLYREGHLSDDKADPGGITKFGISLRFLRSIGDLSGDIDGDGDVDQDDIRALTLDQAKTFYYDHFWIKGKCDQIRSEILAMKVFDMSVNMGISRAWKLTQQACVADVLTMKIDGVPGPITLRTLNRQNENDYVLLDILRSYQTSFYLDLIDADPARAKYKLGWLRRASY